MADVNADQTNTDVDVKDESLLGGKLPVGGAEPKVKAEVKEDEPLYEEPEVKVEVKEGEEEKPEEGEEGEKKDEVPEEYSDDGIELPEGMDLDKEALSNFDPIFKGLKLTQEGRNQVVKGMIQYKAAEAKKAVEDLDATRAGWRKEVRKNPAWEENVGYAKKALAHFGDEDALALINSEGSWLSDHPGLINMFNKVGRSISEDALDNNHRTPKDEVVTEAADILYPNQNKED